MLLVKNPKKKVESTPSTYIFFNKFYGCLKLVCRILLCEEVVQIHFFVPCVATAKQRLEHDGSMYSSIQAYWRL